MPVYSFYIFDRHTECVYQRRWTAPPLSSSARPNGTTTNTPSISRPESRSQASRSSSSGPQPQAATAAAATPNLQFPTSASTPKTANDAKLLFGVVFSLRNLTRRLGGPADDFLTYSTEEYKLHYYETATNLKFCMMTDTKTGNLNFVLQQIWANLWVEYVVRNPLSPIEHGSRAIASGQGVAVGGVGNELFEMGLDRFVTEVFNAS